VEPSPIHERLSAVAGRLTYREIAERTGAHPETVRRYMQGHSPSVEFLAAVCAHLGINGEWMLTGRGPMRARDIRQAALREANAGELLTAMAETLERLRDRVERLEVFVHTMETRLRVHATPNDDAHSRAAFAEVKPAPAPTLTAAPAAADHAGTPGDTHGEPAARPSAARARRIADAAAKPARQDDR